MAVARPITPDLIPPIDPVTGDMAVATGEMYRDNAGDAHIVYRSNFYDREKTYAPENRIEMIDPKTGKQKMRKDQDGNYPVFRNPIRFTERDFILERSPTGEVRMNTDFRPSEREIEDREERRLTRMFESRLAREAVKRGLTAEQLVEQVLGKLQSGDDAPPAPSSAPGRPAVITTGPGWFNVQVDGKMMSEQNLRKPAAEELAESLGNALGAPGEPDGSY